MVNSLGHYAEPPARAARCGIQTGIVHVPRRLIVVVIALALVAARPATAAAQSEYEQAIAKRADGVVDALKLVDDDARAGRVREILLFHYRALRDAQDARDAAIRALRPEAGSAEVDRSDPRVKQVQDQTQAAVDQLHEKFIDKLAAELTSEQVETVKNEMTYNVLPVTFGAYCEIHPKLTETQKAKILEMLAEAREKAVSAFSAKEKHAWFGKYKGRINNYLSSEGYDLKADEKAWRERRKAATQPS
jgi:hypothetical protein